MASDTGEYRNPRRNTIESYVKWSVARGYDIGEIFAGAKAKYPYGDLSKVGDYIAKWGGDEVAIPGVTRVTDRQRSALAQRRELQKIERVSVYTTYEGIKNKGFGEKSWYVDIPKGLTPTEKRAAIVGQLLARMEEEYEGSFATSAELASLIQGIRYVGEK